jgi:hypothetical protein
MDGEALRRASQDGRWVDLFATALLAFVMTAAPIVVHLINPVLAIAFTLVSAGGVALCFERAAPTVILVSYIFQTTFVAMASSHVALFSDLEAMKAYDFLITIGIWATIAARVISGRVRLSPFVCG